MPCDMGPDQAAQRTDFEQSWDVDAGDMKVGGQGRGALETGVLTRHAVGGGGGGPIARRGRGMSTHCPSLTLTARTQKQPGKFGSEEEIQPRRM